MILFSGGEASEISAASAIGPMKCDAGALTEEENESLIWTQISTFGGGAMEFFAAFQGTVELQERQRETAGAPAVPLVCCEQFVSPGDPPPRPSCSGSRWSQRPRSSEQKIHRPLLALPSRQAGHFACEHLSTVDGVKKRFRNGNQFCQTFHTPTEEKLILFLEQFLPSSLLPVIGK